MDHQIPEEYPQIVPMLSYEDAGAAADWLVRAFGFRERMLLTDESGVVTHCELELGQGVVMLASPTPAYEAPRRHAATCTTARKWLEVPHIIDGVHVFVTDVEAHFRRAEAAGARILSGLEDQPYGDRNHTVEDLEGHRWMCSQRIRTVAPDEWGTPSSDG